MFSNVVNQSDPKLIFPDHCDLISVPILGTDQFSLKSRCYHEANFSASFTKELPNSRLFLAQGNHTNFVEKVLFYLTAYFEA